MACLGRALSVGALLSLVCLTLAAQENGKLLIGKPAMGDWTGDALEIRRKITVADLPPPNDTRSANNGPRVAAHPPGRLSCTSRPGSRFRNTPPLFAIRGFS